MQHLRGRIAKSDVRTYASSTVSRHFGAETKNEIGGFDKTSYPQKKKLGVVGQWQLRGQGKTA